MKLTDKSVNQPWPRDKLEKADVILFDDTIPGFGLRLRRRGPDGPIDRRWILQYRSPLTGETKRVTFGSPATLSAKIARDKAGRLHAQVKLGADPQSDKEEGRGRAKETFEKIVTDFLKSREAKVERGELAQATYDQMELALTKHWSGLNRRPIRDITQREIADILTELGERFPIAANRARSWLSTFFVYAMKKGIVKENPAINTERPVEKETPRKRALSDDELIAVWKGCGDDDYGRIARLLILTGQRRDEVAAMTQSELDLDEALWSIPGARTKNNEDHDVPLSSLAVEILRPKASGKRAHVFGRGEAAGFSGFSKSKISLDLRIAAAWPKKEKPFEPWTIHDLRRTVRTGMGKLGIEPHIAEAVLNHLPAKLVRTYDTNKYAAQKRQALDCWAEHLAGLVEGRESKIVHLKRPA
jgi:integrase